MARTRTTRGGPGHAGAPSVPMGGGGTAVLKFMDRRIQTFRGLAPNAYGDLSDVGDPYLADVPAAIAETSETVFDAATQRQQIIRTIECIVPGWADVISTDTVFDPATGWYYMIESVRAEPGIGFYPPRKIFTLRMRSGVTTASD